MALPKIAGPSLFPGKQNSPEKSSFEPVPFDTDEEAPPEFPTYEKDDDGNVIIENDDGSVTIQQADKDDDNVKKWAEFSANLADAIDPGKLADIARDLLEDLEYDRRAREKRVEQYARGIERCGIGQDAPGGADFEGASRATHPMLAEGCVDFAARAIKELFPAQGPVRVQIIGPSTRAQIEKAERKKTFMNYQLTKQISEYRHQLEICLTQVPLGGSQYIKGSVDRLRNRPRVEFVPIDDILLPFAATDFYTAERVTHVQKITRFEFSERVRLGTYRDIGDLVDPGFAEHETKAGEASDKVEGREDNAFNTDGLRTLYEIQFFAALDDDPKAKKDDEGNAVPCPYIVTIDDSTQKVTELRRNWDEDDKHCEKLHWIVEFGFVPWRGAYKIGLAHLIGSLSGAATGALRALLDSAHIANFPGGLRMKGVGGGLAGDSKTAGPTELTQIDVPLGVDDIRKVVMPYPFPGPSSVLYQMLDWLTQHGTEVVGTAEERLGDSATNAPVGTTLAMIEQGSVTYCAIHGRLHESQKRLMEVIHRIDSYLIQDEMVIEELGSLVVRADDFRGPMDVIPVSDPNIFSDAQRYAQLQAALAMAKDYPQEFKNGALVRRALTLINLPNPGELLTGPGDPRELNAIQENVEAAKQEVSLKAYAEQDHLLHLQMHLQFMTSPIWCANPALAMPSLPKLIAHCAEHFLALYTENANAAIQAVLTVQKDVKDEEAATHTALIAMDQQMSAQLASIMPLWMQAQKSAQQFAPQPPQDPAVQVAQMNVQYKTQKDQADAQAASQAAQQKGTVEQAAMAQEAQIEQADNASEERIAMVKESGENDRHTAEMAIATRNADIADATAKEKTSAQLQTSQAAEDGANQRAALSNDVLLAIAQMKSDVSNYQKELGETLGMIRDLMGHAAKQQQIVTQAALTPDPEPATSDGASGD